MVIWQSVLCQVACAWFEYFIIYDFFVAYPSVALSCVPVFLFSVHIPAASFWAVFLVWVLWYECCATPPATHSRSILLWYCSMQMRKSFRLLCVLSLRVGSVPPCGSSFSILVIVTSSRSIMSLIVCISVIFCCLRVVLFVFPRVLSYIWLIFVFLWLFAVVCGLLLRCLFVGYILCVLFGLALFFHLIFV